MKPLRDLFKDEVRKVGIELGIPATFGMAAAISLVRVLFVYSGEITNEKLEITKDADAIFREEIMNAG